MALIKIDGKTVNVPDDLSPEELDQVANELTPMSPLMETVGAPVMPLAAMMGLPGAKASLANMTNPTAGTFGLSRPLEKIGQQIKSEVLPAQSRIESAIMATAPAQAYPRATAAALAIPAMFTESNAGALTPSGLQQDLGAAAIPIAGGEALQQASKVYGKSVNSLDPKVIERAIENPEIMSPDFGAPSKIDEITSGLQRALKQAKDAVSKAYDDFFSKTEGAKRAGKGDPKPITKAIEDAADKFNLKPGETGYVRGKGTSTRLSEPEIADLNSIKTKFAEDIKGTKTRLLTARKLHNQRQELDGVLNSPSTSKFFKTELKKVRDAIDGEIRTHYADIKNIDADFIKVNRAEKALKRRTGITPEGEITEATAAKTDRFARSLETPSGKLYGRGVEERLAGIGDASAMDTVKDVAASAAFNKKAIDLPVVGKLPAWISRRALKDAVEASGRVGGYGPAMIGLPGMIKNSIEKDKKKKK